MEAKRVFEGLTIVTVGLILLGNTLGVLPWSIWWTILMLWPLLVVSLGIDILGRATGSTALRVLASVVVIAGLVYGALQGSGRIAGPQFGIGAAPGESFHQSSSLSGITSGRAHVSAGLARVTLGGGNALASASGETPFGKPKFDVSTEGSTADVEISSGEGSGIRVFPGSRRSFLDASLSSSVAWDRVQVDAGASEVKIDLTRLDVADLVVSTGMSTTDVTFGERPADAKAEISGGMSSYTLGVPKSLGVELRAENGLGSVRVPSGWTRVSGDGMFSGVWRSDGYEASTAKLQLTVKAGLASIDVQRY